MTQFGKNSDDGQYAESAMSLVKAVSGIASGAVAFTALTYYAGRQSLAEYHRQLGIEWLTSSLSTTKFFYAGAPYMLLIGAMMLFVFWITEKVAAKSMLNLGLILLSGSVACALFTFSVRYYGEARLYFIALELANATVVCLSITVASMVQWAIITKAVQKEKNGFVLVLMVLVLAYSCKLIPTLSQRIEGRWDSDPIYSQLPIVSIEGSDEWRLVTMLENQAILVHLNGNGKLNRFKFANGTDLKSIQTIKRQRSFLQNTFL